MNTARALVSPPHERAVPCFVFAPHVLYTRGSPLRVAAKRGVILARAP
jgi:hypothetical protein